MIVRRAGRPVPPAAPYFVENLGRMRKISSLIGKPVVDRQGAMVGTLKDFVVELRAGHVVCAIIQLEGDSGREGMLVQVPPAALASADGGKVISAYPKDALIKAPRYPKASPDDVYEYFQQKPFWSSRTPLGRERTFAGLTKLTVVNRRNATQEVGNILDLTVDLPSGRIILAVVSFNGTEDMLYAVPPAAFKATSVRNALSLERENKVVIKLSKPAPQFWPNLTNPEWVASVYRSYGEDPAIDPGTRQEPDTTSRTTRAGPMP